LSERDDELDRMLESFRNLKPTELQTARWRRLGRPTRTWAAVAAAACIGFLVGALAFRNPEPYRDVAGNFDPTATIERVYVKGQ